MGSISKGTEKPHAVCIPFPAQGHINPMLKLAKLLHSRGFYITFVNTEYNHRRLLKSRGPSALDGLADFRFDTIPDGLPPTDVLDGTQHVPSLCESTMNNCLAPFRDLLARLNASADVPPVSCVVSDGITTFALDAAEDLGVPAVLFWTTSACGFMGYLHYREVIDRGLHITDEGEESKGYLDKTLGWIPGMPNVRLRDLPSFVWTTNPGDDLMVEFFLHETQRVSKASAIILNTFEALEVPVLEALAFIVPPVYPIGPLPLLCRQLPKSPMATMDSNLWKEDTGCLEWLEGRRPGSVVYVNFGSITVMTNQQLLEFAWGLAGSGQDFLWIIRPDIVRGDSAVLPEQFLEETRLRGFLASWCPQEEVLAHSAVGGFLTHSGWNSTLESICGGVPMLCWPFFAEQQTNCRYACVEWGIGMEIDNDVKRDKLSDLIKELMEGDRGEEMRRIAWEWKERAGNAVNGGGFSVVNLDKLVREVLLMGTERAPICA